MIIALKPRPLVTEIGVDSGALKHDLFIADVF
jgi:hypothetical protein